MLAGRGLLAVRQRYTKVNRCPGRRLRGVSGRCCVRVRAGARIGTHTQSGQRSERRGAPVGSPRRRQTTAARYAGGERGRTEAPQELRPRRSRRSRTATWTKGPGRAKTMLERVARDTPLRRSLRSLRPCPATGPARHANGPQGASAVHVDLAGTRTSLRSMPKTPFRYTVFNSPRLASRACPARGDRSLPTWCDGCSQSP